MMLREAEVENIEMQLLLEGIFLRYGYDFRNYAKTHLKRRIKRRMEIENISSYAEMLSQTLRQVVLFRRLLDDLSVQFSEMFRDPTFFNALRNEVMPFLRTFPFVRIWHAGCSSGEEVYSTAILLEEAGLLERTQIYATDYSADSLKKARAGRYPLTCLDAYSEKYKQSGGTGDVQRYFEQENGELIAAERFRKNILFAEHNLQTDQSFGEMNLIMCRNVLIYFDRELQNRTISLFRDSLSRQGVLCLGMGESLRFSEVGRRFSAMCEPVRIYQKAS